MDVNIRLSKESDFSKYLDLMQRTYKESFTNESLGLTKELFSKEIFHTPTAISFLQNMMKNNDRQRCWLAFSEGKLIGSITMTEEENKYHFGGFYVDTKYQGLGIGRKLWNLTLEGSKGKDIVLGVYTHNTKAIFCIKNGDLLLTQAKIFSRSLGRLAGRDRNQNTVYEKKK